MDLPSGRRNVKTLNTSKRYPPSRCDRRTPLFHFGSDAGRGPSRIHCEASRCGQALPRVFSMDCASWHADPLSSYLTSRRALTTYIPVISFMEISTEYVIVQYIVSPHIDTRQSNIFVDATGHARITASGLATTTQDLGSTQRDSAERSQSPRWIAPEILGNQGTYSKEADVFSFAGVTIEVRTWGHWVTDYR